MSRWNSLFWMFRKLELIGNRNDYLVRRVRGIIYFENAPEFFAEDYKVNHNSRDTLDNFTDLGKKQMSFMPWQMG